MGDDVYYVPDSGMDDAQEYADQIDYFVDDSKVLDEETNLGKTGIGYGSYILQKAVKKCHREVHNPLGGSASAR